MLGQQSQAHSTHRAPFEARFKEALRLNRELFFSSPVTLYQEHTDSVPSYRSLESVLWLRRFYMWRPIIRTSSCRIASESTSDSTTIRVSCRVPAVSFVHAADMCRNTGLENHANSRQAVCARPGSEVAHGRRSHSQLPSRKGHETKRFRDQGYDSTKTDNTFANRRQPPSILSFV